MPYSHDTRAPEDCQVAEKRPRIDFRKSLSRVVSNVYLETGLGYMQRRGAAMRSCGDRMLVRRYDTADEQTEIVYTRFCGVRMCPICAHRRGLKAFWQLSRIMDYVDAQRSSERGSGYAYILITLTLQNVPGDALSEALQRYIDGCTRLFRTRQWQAAIKGAWRSLEITYNQETDTFHPHVHLFCAVNPSYFTDKTYISHAELLRLWRRSARLPYDPSVHIERVKEDELGKSKAEVSKYVSKQGDLVLKLPRMKAQQLLIFLEDSLANRKQWISYGIFREAARALHLTDEDAQLLDPTDGDKELLEQLRPAAAYLYQLVEYDIPTSSYIELDPFVSDASIEQYSADKRGMYRRFRGAQLSQLVSEGLVSLDSLSEYQKSLIDYYGEQTFVRKDEE